MFDKNETFFEFKINKLSIILVYYSLIIIYNTIKYDNQTLFSSLIKYEMNSSLTNFCLYNKKTTRFLTNCNTVIKIYLTVNITEFLN
jgi:hypothetical protein